MGMHQLWGLWAFTADPDAATLDVVPLRTGGMHINALPFLEPPPLVNLTLESLKFNGDIIDADIGLRHPFLGLTEFTGFDVCGILITRGSKGGYDDASLLFPGNSDTRLLNPDGFSRWWNPVEFPVNKGTMFSYNDGLLGTKHATANFTATVNGYKYFADALEAGDDIDGLPLSSRGMFSAGQQNIRHYKIQMGNDGLVFNYAVDACWQFPTGPAPWNAPDDFGEDANRPEPYRITTTEIENTLWNDGTDSGGDLKLLLRVYDWYHAGDDTLRVESPGAFPAVDVTTPDFSDEHSATYTVSVTEATPPQSGSIELFITAASEKTGYGGLIPGASVAAYFFASAAVDDQAPPEPEDQPWPRFHRDYGCKGLTDIVGTLNSTPKWNFDTGGALSEGIAIDDEGTAYFGSCSGSFYAVKADGGKKWSYAPSTDHIKSSPSFDGLGHVFFGTNIGVLYCLYTSDGEGVWKIDIGAPILTPATYRDGKVYLGSHDDHMYCVDATDGSPVWDLPTGMDIYGGACFDKDGGLYWASGDGIIYHINPDTGSVIWTYPFGGIFYNSIAIDGNTLYAGNNSGSFRALDLNLTPSQLGFVKWMASGLGNIRTSPAIDSKGNIYFGTLSGGWYKYSPAGIQLQSKVFGSQFVTSFAIDGKDKIYGGNYDGNVYCWDSDGNVVWLFNTGDSVSFSPGIAGDGRVIIGSWNGYVYCFGD
jgi:outer membrane protein assembly factor BamB